MSALTRLADFVDASSAAPKAIPTFLSISDSRSKLKSYFSANARLSSTLSKLAPRIVQFSFSNS